MPLIIKLLALLFASISIAKSYIDYRKHQEPRTMFVFWSVIWIAAATIVIFPTLIDQVVAYTKERTISLGSLVSLSFIFMLYIVYRIYTKAARIEYQQAQLIRKLGLRGELKKTKK